MQVFFNSNYIRYNLPTETPSFQAKPSVNKTQLETLIQKGVKVQIICENLNITKSQYYRLINIFKIQTPRKKSIENSLSITKEQLQGLISSGRKISEIIKELGITDTTYLSLLAKFNIITNHKSLRNNISSISKETLLSLVNSGKTVKTICKELQIPERTYSRLLDKFGIVTERKQAKAHIASITREQLASLVQKGISKQEICKVLKLTDTTFYKLLKRFNIPYNYLHHSNEIEISKEELKEALKTGKTTKEMAKDLGVSVTCFHEKAKINNVDTELRSSIDKIATISVQEFQTCLDSGMTIENICKKFNISTATYSSVIRRYNLKTKQRESNKIIANITKDQILELKKLNKTPPEICNELNISQSTYYRILNSN